MCVNIIEWQIYLQCNILSVNPQYVIVTAMQYTHTHTHNSLAFAVFQTVQVFLLGGG